MTALLAFLGRFSPVVWAVLADQLHNIIIALGAIMGGLGFTSGSTIAGWIGSAIALLASGLSSKNVANSMNTQAASAAKAAAPPVPSQAGGAADQATGGG